MVAMTVRPRIFLIRSLWTLALAGPILFGMRVVRAQDIPMLPRELPEKKHKLKDKFPEKPSQMPSFTIPVGATWLCPTWGHVPRPSLQPGQSEFSG